MSNCLRECYGEQDQEEKMITRQIKLKQRLVLQHCSPPAVILCCSNLVKLIFDFAEVPSQQEGYFQFSAASPDNAF